MARRAARQMNTPYISGNLARDFDFPERESRRRPAQDPGTRRAPDAAPKQAPRRRAAEKPKHRERIQVSFVSILGFAATAVMAMALLMSYAQLATISNQVVRQQRALASLQEEHVKLVAQYEKTFDLTAIKEAAESAGMAKPSASQIYYIDLSEPDNIVLYQRAETNVLGRVVSSVGADVASVVEYFK